MNFPYSYYHISTQRQSNDKEEVKDEPDLKKMELPPKSPSENANIPIQTDKVGTRLLLDVEQINQGAVKIVWAIKKSDLPPSGQDSLSADQSKNAYYTPVYSFLKTNEKELKREFETMKEIKKELEKKGLSIAYLAVNAEEVPEELKIKGEYTLKVNLADGGNFEDKLRDNTPLQEKIALGGHLLAGLAALHETGRAYGDIKPENFMIYGNTLKIGDFGKTVKVEDGTTNYKGNTRYAPPEGVLSKKGDVYGAALVLIRMFEESYLKSKGVNSLVELKSDHPNFDKQAKDSIRGIEKLTVEHKAFPASNPGYSVQGMMRRLTMSSRPVKEREEQSKAVATYIGYLQFYLLNAKTLKLDAKTLKLDQIEKLVDLLKAMTTDDMNKRISMAEASRLYHEIFQLA